MTIIIFIPLNFIIHERKNIPLFSANKYLIYFLKEQLSGEKKCKGFLFPPPYFNSCWHRKIKKEEKSSGFPCCL